MIRLSRRTLLLSILTVATSPALPVSSYAQTKNAHVDQPISSGTFVNLLWDTTWDNDDPALTTARIDAITQAVVYSSYFNRLAEYGVNSVSFAGSFLPDPSCPSKAPDSVGFYDPFKASIAGFVQCEHDHGPALLRQNNVVYNIILPPSSIESDFWSGNFCSGPGSPAAWHYHGLENNLQPFGGAPIYTINQSNSQCGGNTGLVSSMFHEMVEAATDPSPIDISIIPPHINVQAQNEIADLCEGNDLSIFTNSHGATPLFTSIGIPTYWSNAQQRCVGFGDTTQPGISSVAITNWGLQTSLNISGNGFGGMPAAINLPSPVLPYVEVNNTTLNTLPWRRETRSMEIVPRSPPPHGRAQKLTPRDLLEAGLSTMFPIYH